MLTFRLIRAGELPSSRPMVPQVFDLLQDPQERYDVFMCRRAIDDRMLTS